jgi:FixJ family two-component response regulator
MRHPDVVRHRVLIVEDETTFAKNVAAFLARKGYRVAHAASAEDGLAQVGAFRPDVLLLDLDLPGMSGLEMLTALRQRELRMEVVLVTGHGREAIGAHAIAAGAVDWLQKPVSLRRIGSAVERALGGLRAVDGQRCTP